MEKYERGTRSYTMSHIRGKDTKIEVLVRSYLFRKGCFWHMHEGCSKHSMPKSNVEFWQAKLLRNHNRDIAQRAELEASGWRVITVWECELTKAARDGRLARLYEQIVCPSGFPLEGSCRRR